MTKSEVIGQIIHTTGLDKPIVSTCLEMYFTVIKDAVSQGKTVYMRGFGSFAPKYRARKMGRHIAKNTAVVVESHSIPSFKPARELARQIRSIPWTE